MPAAAKKHKNSAVPKFLKKLGITESEWQYIAKGDLKALMRPGWPLRTRVVACILLQSSGFNRDLCVRQVPNVVTVVNPETGRAEKKKGAPKLEPLWPAAIRKLLEDVALEAYAETDAAEASKEALLCKAKGVKFDSFIVPDETHKTRLAEIRKSLDKGNVSRCLQELEHEDGFIVRVRANCPPEKLIREEITLEAALKAELVTPFASLSRVQRLRIHKQTLIFKLPTPNPATVKALERKVDEDEKGAKNGAFSPADVPRRSFQLFLRFVPERQVAAELLKRQDVQVEFDAYQRRIKEAEDGFKTYLQSVKPAVSPTQAAPDHPGAPQAPKTGNLFDAQDPIFTNDRKNGAERAAGTIQAPPQNPTGGEAPPSSDYTAEEFHRDLVGAFAEAGRSTPTRKQTRPLYDQLGDRAPDFAAAVTPELIRSRGIQHPGILPRMVEEFTDTTEARKKQPKQQGPSCYGCGLSLAGGSVDGLCFDCFEKRSGAASA